MALTFADNLAAYFSFDNTFLPPDSDECGNLNANVNYFFGTPALSTDTPFGQGKSLSVTMSTQHSTDVNFFRANNIKGFGAQSFSFDGWCQLSTFNSPSITYNPIMAFRSTPGLTNPDGSSVKQAGFVSKGNCTPGFSEIGKDYTYYNAPIKDSWFHFAFSYDHPSTTSRAFINGTCIASYDDIVFPKTDVYRLGFGGYCGRSVNYSFTGKYDYIRLFNGVSIWNQNFSPPTLDDYIALENHLYRNQSKYYMNFAHSYMSTAVAFSNSAALYANSAHSDATLASYYADQSAQFSSSVYMNWSPSKSQIKMFSELLAINVKEELNNS